MMMKNETQDVVIFDYLVNFYFIYFLLHVEELSFCLQFLSLCLVGVETLKYRCVCRPRCVSAIFAF